MGGSVIDDVVGGVLPTTAAVDTRRSLVFVINRAPGDGDGSISVVDADTGLLRHTIPVGRHPISLAVDETTARLFVANTNAGCVHRSGPWDYVPSFLRPLLPFLPSPPPPDCGVPGSVSVIDTSRL